MGALRSIDIPQLWVLAEQDRDTPPALNLPRLAALQREGKPIEVVSFPNTDHGMVEYVEKPDGTRTTTRHTEGYYRLIADWIRRDLSPPYGTARFHPRAKR
jgi:dipeptidyl aminopeptidase/acylaminoacyl peptidase